MIRFIVFISFFLLPCLAKTHTVHSSCWKSRILGSELILKGVIAERNSFWDESEKNIYTIYLINVDTVIKGKAGSTIQLKVEGGIIGNIWHKVSSAPELNLHQSGYFLLKRAEPTNDSPGTYILNEGKNGFMQSENPATREGLKTINNLLPEFRKALKDFTSCSEPFNDSEKISLKSAASEQTLTGISPLELTAGTGDILTIHGSGFGAIQDDGEVWFSYANSGNSLFTNSGFDVKLWSDTLIRIVVPAEAATGKVTVKKEGTSASSSNILKVRYACSNYDFLPIVLINTDNNGGYTWHLHSSIISNPQAAETVEKSIGKWVCATSVPWRIGTPTTAGEGKDGKCIISFGSLEGIPAKASVFLEGISGSAGITEWVLVEVDIILNENQNWGYSRDSLQNGQTDFETAVLHELAHAQLFGHVKDENDLLHYGLENGQFRDIGDANIECGHYILNRSMEFKHRNYKTIKPVQPEILGLPGEISGPANLCSTNQANIYSIPKIENASGYTWELNPYNAAVLAPDDTMVTVTWSEYYSGEATLTVIPHNYCGSIGSVSTLKIGIHPQHETVQNISVCQGESYNGWTEEGEYVSYLVSDQGCDSISTTYLTVNELPQPAITVMNDTLFSSESFAAYQWYDEDGPIDGAHFSRYVILKSGIYYLIATNENGCSLISEGVNAMVTSVNETELLPLCSVIYPNPSSGSVVLQINNIKPGKILVKIVNLAGQTHFQKEMNIPGIVHTEQLDVLGWVKGTYFITVSNGKQATTQPLILQ